MSINTLEQTFFDILRKEMLNRIEDETKYVVQGAAEDYANYRERVGKLSELKSLLVFFEEKLKAFDPY